jgi:hypothetical protein
MKRPTAPEALYSSDSYNEHRLRSSRRPDGQILPEGVTDLESPDACWNAADHIREIDPQGDRALALLREIASQH